jgi:hypothetical protein
MGPGFGRRPNVAPGCNKETSGSAASPVPAGYTFGNESATDPSLRGPGIGSFDFSLAKMTPIKERFNLEFRAEIFNVFNRVESSLPNESITTAANPATGYITSQISPD